jgi:hypothetical protein
MKKRNLNILELSNNNKSDFDFSKRLESDLSVTWRKISSNRHRYRSSGLNLRDYSLNQMSLDLKKEVNIVLLSFDDFSSGDFNIDIEKNFTKPLGFVKFLEEIKRRYRKEFKIVVYKDSSNLYDKKSPLKNALHEALKVYITESFSPMEFKYINSKQDLISFINQQNIIL